MRRICTLSALFLFASAAFPACAGPLTDDETAFVDDDLRIRPIGTDDPGSLRVSAPAGAWDVGPTTVKCLQNDVPLGEAITPLPVGRHAFRTETHSEEGYLQVGSYAEIALGKTTAITTGLLSFEPPKGPRTLGIGDLWSSTGIPFKASPASALTVSGGLYATSKGVELFPVLEGEYDVQFGLGAIDGIRVRVGANEVVRADLLRLTDRRVTRVKAPVRELPTASCSGTATDRWTIGLSSGTTTQQVAVAAGEELDLGVSPRHEGVSYTLSHPTWLSPHAVPLGERGAGPRPWAIGRIDVDDVTINGGPQTVRGYYAIFPANVDGNASGPALLRCKPPTNTGVDVPPGRYRVEIEYDTVASGRKKDVHVVDVL